MGSGGNDTFDASTLNSLQNADSITDISITDADVLNATVGISGTLTPAIIKNVETINLTAGFGTLTLDATNVTGSKAINVSSSVASGTVTVENTTVGAVNVGSNVVTATVKSKASGTNGDVTVNGGSATTLTVTSENGAETGNSSFKVTADSATTVDLTGADKADTFVATLNAATSVTAAGGTGNDSYNLTIGVPTTIADIDGGAGNDTYVVTLANGTNTITTADGGAGTDAYTFNLSGGTVAITSDGTVETLNLASNGVANTVNFTLTASTNTLNVSGDKDITLKDLAANFAGLKVANTNTGITTMQLTSTAPSIDLSDVATSVVIDVKTVNAANHDITVADGAQVKMSQDSTTNRFNLVSGSDASGTVNVTLAGDASIGFETADFETVAITNADSGVASTSLIAVFDTTDTTVTLAGAHALTLGSTSTAKKVDASALSGVLTAEVNAGLLNLVGGTGKDVITIADADLTSTSVTIDGGAGDDTIVLAGSGTMDADDDETLAIAGGTGTDTLKLTGDFDFSSTSNLVASTMTSIEKIDVNDNDLTLTQKQLITNGAAITLSDSSVGNTGTVTVEMNTSSATSVDLSGLSFEFGAAGGVSGVTVTGTAQADVIIASGKDDTVTGAAGSDKITGGEGSDNITGGAGADTITLTETTAKTDTVVVASGDSTEAAMDAITGFAVGASNADVLDLDSTTVSAISAIDITSITTETETGSLTAAVNASGIITLSASATSETANVNTLAEWVDIAEALYQSVDVATNTTAYHTLAFEFGGDTYVFQGKTVDAAASETQTTDSIVKLVGLVGVTALSTTNAANTIDLG